MIFSPSFDHKISDNLNFEPTMNEAGYALEGRPAVSGLPEIKGAVSRHLSGNHLGGGSPYTDYAKFNIGSPSSAPPWLQLHLFQSGHGGGCSGLTNHACAAKRAREMPQNGNLTPRARTNMEGPYDLTPAIDGTLPDNRHGMRHIGWLSVLSGALGFTNGLDPIVFWNNPLNTLSPLSTQDMKRLGDRMRLAPWYDLRPQHGWIANQSNVEEQKMALAVTGNNGFALAYMPNNATMEIRNDSTGLNGLSCSSPWTITWFNPRDSSPGAQTQGTCSLLAGKVVLGRTQSCPAGDGAQIKCDWGIELRNTSVPLPLSAATASEMVAWAAPAEEDLSSSIRAVLRGRHGEDLSPEIVVSPAGRGAQRLPVVARDASGDFWVVWEAEGLDGDGSGIYARRFDAQGNAVGAKFQMNDTWEGNQYEPAVTADGFGTVTVVWTGYRQGGEAGSVVLRRFNRDGTARGPEVVVNSAPSVHQHSPRVATSPGGALVVGWETGREGTGQRVELQRFNPQGSAVGTSSRAAWSALGDHYLAGLAVGAAGDFKLDLVAYDGPGRSPAYSAQVFDRDGKPVGSHP